MNPSQQKPVTVLYLGSLTHSDDTSFLDRTKPHEDQIDFQTAVKLSLIRIPRPGKDIYSKHISITQTQAIKNFEIYYRNLEKTGGRYSLLMCTNELVVNQNDDILITPKQPVTFFIAKIFTDLLLFKGNFTKITLCIYGNTIKDEHFLSQKCPNYKTNAPIEPFTHPLIQMYQNGQSRKKDIFQEKRQVIREIQAQTTVSNSVEEWHEIVNDDGINEQQIENICNLSQKLLTTYNNQRLTQEDFVVQFRAGLQDISTNLAKIFKNKHLGLYYPSFEEFTISNDLSLSIIKLALYSLDLSLSEQVRGLQILKYVLQLDRHTDFFIQYYGVEKLMRIFVDFFKVGSVVLSTYKNLCIQVLITVSHWKKAAIKMTQTVSNAYYHEIFEQKSSHVQRISEDRQRSREKKTTKRSRSESAESESGDDNKKKKKDKQKKRNKSREKKKGKESKSKEELLKKPQEEKQQPVKILSLRDQIPDISFYEILLFLLSRQKRSKQLILVKILLQQILQTITKNKVISERVALSTSQLKDLKYIFNPTGEVLNTKSLKQFASCYQPFLNNVQSEGVDSEIVAEREKLRNMKKYGIDPKMCKILNKISFEIASSECEQNADETKTPFYSSFIVMMSELIRSQDPSVLYGFGRLLSSFKQGSSRDIIHLKRIEAAMTMLSEYIYKVLVEDDGLFTVLNIDQIYTALINISNCLSKDQSAFTKELKRKVRQLTNYAMAYDLFTSSEGNFKTISQYFLRLFKFEHYEINKISDFKKKEFDKALNPFSISNISESYALGSFHQLFPEQPLLEIDVYLKIFNMVLQYNRNVWPLFYQNKLVSGFSVLFVKLSNLIIFLLGSGVEREFGLINIKKLSVTVENYLNVMFRLLKILAKKAEYEAAFNDLMDEDNFENVELYEKSLSLYVSLFNAVNRASSLLSPSCKYLARQILSKVLVIYDKLLESYELSAHVSRQTKVKELWLMVYETHFFDLKSRAACLSLFAFFAQTLQSNTIKIFNTLCLEESLKIQTPSGTKTKGFIPKNEKSLIQNLIHANIYRNDPIIRVNLALLIKNLAEKNSQKNPIIEKIATFFEKIFDEIDFKLKEKGNAFQSVKDLILLEKVVLLIDILKRLNCVLTLKFEEKLIKNLKFVDSIKRYPNEENSDQQTAYKLSLEIKTNIISFLKKSFQEKSEHPQILNLIQILAKNLDFSNKLTNSISQNSFERMSSGEVEIEKESLRLINSSLDLICSCSSNPYNQSIILYEVFLEKPYKPAPQISLQNLFVKLTSSDFIKFFTSSENSMMFQDSNFHFSHSNVQALKENLKQIAFKMIYLLCLLTTIDSRQFYSTESRRNAIICLLGEDKEFPFSKIELLRPFIPYQLIQTLKDYFAYPIVEKPLVIKIEEKKQTIKNKGYLFSKALFSIIMEGEPTAKSRYPYIGGPWKSGDLVSNFFYTPSRQRNYLKIVSKSFSLLQSLEKTYDHQFFSKFSALNSEKVEPQPIELSISNYKIILEKRTKIVEKKQTVETQIKNLNIPLVLQNLGPKIQQQFTVKRVSPSPSSKGGYGKGSSTYDNRGVRVSPSPPSTKIPSQNIIGFNNLSQTPPQYGSQNLQNTTGFPPNVQTTSSVSPISQPPMQVSNIPMYQQPSHLRTSPYESHQPVSTPSMERPTYPNPYYSTNPVQNPVISDSQVPPVGTMSYIEMQKISSQESTGQMRSGSNSAPRSNVPYGSGMGYQPQKPYYPANQPYMAPGGHKMSGYDNRSHSPYQHQNKPYSQNYGNQRMHHGGGYYQNPQDRSMGGGYGNYGQQMMGNNPRQSGYQSQQMGNRQPYNPNNGHYQKYDYQQRTQSIGQNYPPGNQYPPQSGFNQAQEDERQFNDAILLVTELRGTLPEHLKNDKKNRLNQILNTNIRVQNRVKEYISNLQ